MDEKKDRSSTAARQRAAADDERLDTALDQTFPASDPIPWIYDESARGSEFAANISREGTQLYLDDFSVGQRFVTGSAVVSTSEIKSFASRFDPQPFHLDETAASQSLFGGLAASGWHTAALGMRLLVDSDMRIAGGLIGLGGEITWPRPVRPGDVLATEIEVLEVTPSNSKPDRGVVKTRNTTRNQHGEPVQIAIMKLIVPRKSD